MDNQKTNLYGNEKILKFFSTAAKDGKLAHAYIFEGGRGSGKHTLARRISCLLACQSLFERPCFLCESCRKITEGISPDVIEVALLDDKKSIGVEQIRELRSSVYIKPTEEDVKVYIISNAELMTEQAQNVFLKVLEEPPRGVYFFMLCENTSNILATVKSRAPVLKMQIFSDSELKNYLIENNKTAKSLSLSNPDEFDLIIRIAEGKIGEAERLLSDNKSGSSQSKHEKAKKLIDIFGSATSFPEYCLFVQNIAKNREELLDILLYSIYATRDLIAVKKTDGENCGLIFYSDREDAAKLASKFTANGVIKIYDELCRAHREASTNANMNNLLTCLAYELKMAASI